MNKKLKTFLTNLGKPIFAIIVSLFIGALLIIPTGTSPIEAYMILFKGAFGSWQGFSTSLAKATPLLFTGLAAAYSFRAGVFNIGIEGQLYFGAIASALTGVYFGNLPPAVLIPICMIAAMVIGMAWAFIPAILNVKLNISIFITCIMLNNIAQLFSNYLATYPFKGELAIGATYKISEGAMLPKLAGAMNDLNFGFIIAIILSIILYILLFKTKFGYESRAAGISRTFSRYIGIDATKKTIIIVMISGAIAGLAGAEQVMGVNYRYISDFSPGLGYTGITVALLARNNPLACILTAIFFGALTNGAIQMEVMTNISRDLISSVQAVMIVFIAADFAFDYFKKKKKADKNKTVGSKKEGKLC
ncbi:ABC transporter permease [Maledivibacter halophilus]|uniref:Nucleoside ABC transporter membrane protein n=1 Tax=Maledivibacter halophilus TaxID=36842 RepID=A0A1T5LM41_9FIRM|nr:ABC transporter permease [Maledivibacter halophilus]SKC76609.1 nucleoside ABC transporter membrane protein [Maledivibacter halophilus]